MISWVVFIMKKPLCDNASWSPGQLHFLSCFVVVNKESRVNTIFLKAFDF